jgi:hypothetical protein
MQYYAQRDKAYTKQDDSVQALKTWVSKTVSPHYIELACDPTENLAQWYTKLKTILGTTDIRSQISASEKYQQAIKPLTKAKDWSKWLANWESSIGLAQKKGVPETLAAYKWTTDFLRAVRPIAEHWATSYGLTQEQAIEKGLITYRDIANSFRKEMSTMRVGYTGRPSIAKGAFGPSFAGQDDSGQGANNGDAQNSAEGASQRSRRRPAKRTRAPDEDIPSTVTRSCGACGLPHPLSNCYYVFPEKAPPRFTENPELRSVVDEALEADSALQEEVRNLKSKRAKSTERAKSTSSNRSSSTNRSNTRNRSREPKVIEEDD